MSPLEICPKLLNDRHKDPLITGHFDFWDGHYASKLHPNKLYNWGVIHFHQQGFSFYRQIIPLFVLGDFEWIVRPYQALLQFDRADRG